MLHEEKRNSYPVTVNPHHHHISPSNNGNGLNFQSNVVVPPNFQNFNGDLPSNGGNGSTQNHHGHSSLVNQIVLSQQHGVNEFSVGLSQNYDNEHNHNHNHHHFNRNYHGGNSSDFSVNQNHCSSPVIFSSSPPSICSAQSYHTSHASTTISTVSGSSNHATYQSSVTPVPRSFMSSPVSFSMNLPDLNRYPLPPQVVSNPSGSEDDNVTPENLGSLSQTVEIGSSPDYDDFSGDDYGDLSGDDYGGNIGYSFSQEDEEGNLYYIERAISAPVSSRRNVNADDLFSRSAPPRLQSEPDGN